MAKKAIATIEPEANPLATTFASQELPIQTQVFVSDEDRPNRRAPLTTEQRQKAQKVFLATYPSTGRIDLACAAADVSTRTFYRWMQFPEFKQRFELARQSIIHMAESRLAQIAFSNSKLNNGLAFSATMAILNAEAAEKYRPRMTHDVNVSIRDYRGFGK